MDWIPAKIRLIRQNFGMTQLELAQASGLSQRDISQLENGRKEGLPKPFIQFLHSRGVDLNWLFTDPAAELPAAGPRLAAPYQLADEPAALAQEADRPGYGRSGTSGPLIRMVDQQAAAAYPRRYPDEAFQQQLPVLSLPLPAVQQEPCRAFQVGAGAPAPLQAQDWVLARQVVPVAGLEAEGAVYVVVTGAGLTVARLFSVAGQPELLQLQAAPTSRRLRRPDVLELWRVVGYLSFQLPAAASPAVTTLAEQYQDLLNRVQRLEQER